MRKILFILNPIAGTRNKETISDQISSILSPHDLDYKIIYTEFKGHAKEIVKHNLQNNYDTIVAIGGDGTINEVAELLIDTDISLGIIPIGSGNGYARSLNIPMNIEKSIKTIIANKKKLIDTVSINDLFFFNVAGTGFDSHIAELFASNKKRGFISYIKLVISEFLSFKTQQSTLIVDGKESVINYFMISFANSSQFGNNAYVSPNSIMDDGFIEIVIFKKIGFITAINLAIRLYLKNIHKSKHVSYIKTKSAIIDGNENMQFHIDGEPILLKAPININVLPCSLTVIIG